MDTNTIVVATVVTVVFLIIVYAFVHHAEQKRLEEDRERLSREREYALRQRREHFLQKYGGDTELVDRLMRQSVWEGQTEDQLLDSLGKPLDVDQRVLKTKKKEVWKYNATGTNRNGVRITVENGTVVGWDIKD
jgi:hypothetical protein